MLDWAACTVLSVGGQIKSRLMSESQHLQLTSASRLTDVCLHLLQQTGQTGAAGGAGLERQQAESRAHHHSQLSASPHILGSQQLHLHLPRGPPAA